MIHVNAREEHYTYRGFRDRPRKAGIRKLRGRDKSSAAQNRKLIRHTCPSGYGQSDTSLLTLRVLLKRRVSACILDYIIRLYSPIAKKHKQIAKSCVLMNPPEQV
jgi:hypothetical protein